MKICVLVGLAPWGPTLLLKKQKPYEKYRICWSISLTADNFLKFISRSWEGTQVSFRRKFLNLGDGRGRSPGDLMVSKKLLKLRAKCFFFLYKCVHIFFSWGLGRVSMSYIKISKGSDIQEKFKASGLQMRSKQNGAISSDSQFYFFCSWANPGARLLFASQTRKL